MATKKSTKQNLTPAVSYVRMSSDKQEDSPDQQRAEIAKLAKTHGCEILKEYFDEGISGTETKKRTSFTQMLVDAKHGDFKVILLWDQDRFSRVDSIDAGELVAPLRRAGVRLITVAQGVIDWNNFANRIVYSVQQEGKNAYVRDLSRNSLRGVISNLMNGKLNINQPPYALEKRVNDEHGNEVRRVKRHEKFSVPKGWTSKLVPGEDEQEIEVVQWIFDRYGNTVTSMRTLVTKLNQDGVPSPHGGVWHATSVRGVLKNPAYCGYYVFGRHRKGKFHNFSNDGVAERLNGDAAPGLIDEKDCFVVPGAFEALVDRKLWEKCQRRLKENRKNSGPAKDGNAYYLAGLIRCGHCGYPMHGRRRTDGNRPLYYLCSRYNMTCTCKPHSIRQDVLLPFIIKKLQEAILGGNKLDELRKKVREQLQDRAAASGTNGSDRRLKKIYRDIDQALKRFALCTDDKVAELLMVEISAMQRQREELRSQAAAVPRSKQAGVHDVDAIVAGLATLHDDLESTDPTRMKEVLRRLVSRIELFYTERKCKKKSRYPLQRGIIYVRPGELLASTDLSNPAAISPGDDRSRLACPHRHQSQRCRTEIFEWVD